MKRFLSLLALLSIGASLLTVPYSQAFYASYEGVDNANDYADSVIQGAGGVTAEKTTAATNNTTSDVWLYRSTGSELYIGYNEAFDGISADVYNSSSGSYSVKYWNGSSWASLVGTNSGSISDSTDGTFQIEWPRPSSWSRTTVLMNTDEDGNTNEYSGSYYFIKLVVESSYSSNVTFSQVGIINYNVVFNMKTELNTSLEDYTINFDSSEMDAGHYVSKQGGDDYVYFGFYAPSSATLNYTTSADGFVDEENSMEVSSEQASDITHLQYAHKIYARDADDNSSVNITSAYAGSDNTNCTISGGVAYCPVPVSEDGDDATVQASGYSTETVAISNRTSNSTSQQLAYAYMNDGTSTNNKPDLMVDDLYFSNDSLWARIENNGDDDVSSSDSVYVYVYVDGDREYSGTIGYNYFDEGESNVFAFLEGDFQDGESYDLEVCIDGLDHVDESNETNNCREETLRMGGSSGNEPNLTVNDIYFDDDALWADIENDGDDDVSSGDTIYVYVYVDDDREETGTISYKYFEEGEENSFKFLEDELDSGESYDFEVCIDATDQVDENDENDNCRKETLKVGSSSSNNDPDLDVTAIDLQDDGDLTFTVKNRGDDDVENGEAVTIKVYIDGDLEYTKNVTQSSSSTNFLDEGEEDTYNAGDILDNEGNNYEVEVCVDTGDDVSESSESNNCMTVDEDTIGSENDNESCGNFTDLDGHYSEPYVCDLYDREIVQGRTSTRFYPDSTTTRAEFLKMALLNAELEPYSNSSIHYTDVSSHDWYYTYVTYATTRGYVDGYSDGSFRPNNSITRAEALVILMRIADQEKWTIDNSDINFWDVDEDDWFAYAVVIGDEDNLVSGYSDGSFRPNNAITRGEAAKILDLAYDEYFN